jgi:hypothetical protein
MAGTPRKYFYGKTATIDFKQDGGTSITVGVLQGVEIRFVAEHVDLEGCGSVLRQGIARKKIRVKVKGTVRSMQLQLLADIVSPTHSKWTSGTGTLSGTEDSDQVSLFDVVAVCNDQNGKAYTVTAKNVVFPDLPMLVGTYGEWVEWELSGEGDDVTAVEAV